MKNIFIFGGISVLVLVLGVWWSDFLIEKQPKEQAAEIDDTNIVSRSGLHYHSNIKIFVNNEPIPIPGDIGIGLQYANTPTYDKEMRMTAMHTHDPDGTIHLEFPSLVTKDDMKLGNFFLIWGKDFMSFGPTVSMTVNGVENAELENYEMKDGDKIELYYQ